MLVKRGLDIVLSGIGLVVLAPFMAVVALLVRLDSAGSPVFGQERVGLEGKVFTVWKFRTMHDGASEAVHRHYVGQMLSREEPDPAAATVNGRKVFKLTADPRVTRVGYWLRKTSIDELPQLLNVFRGEMSLVGPRPPLPYECEQYEAWQFERLCVRPGITGLWQVSGRSLLSYRRMCELDIEYIRKWSLLLDLVILLRTAPVVLFNMGQAT
jgi:lipopolysaccharide/colanic/teichoic acid biosynthesis glycosyltransferase